MATTISIPCPATVLPTKADLVNIFVELASIPSQIEAEVAKLEERAAFNPNLEEVARVELERQASSLRSAAEDVRKTIDSIKDAMGNYPISMSDPVYAGLSAPDLEWERRAAALTQEYHLYVQSKMMELINAVLPISFSVPILGLSIDIVQVFSSPSYRAGLKAQIQADVDSFFGAIPEPYKTFDGTYGVDSAAIKAEIVWSYIMGELQKGGLGILYGAFGGLISKFSTIWNALGLPALPALTDLNVKGLIEAKIASIRTQIQSMEADAKTEIAKLEENLTDPNLSASAKAEIESQLADAQYYLRNELCQQVLDAIDSISIAGFGIDQITGGDVNDHIVSLEQKIERKLEAMRDFGENWPEYLIKEWMKKVTAFFNAIGLSALVQWITFNFCQFLQLIGLPTSITVNYEFNPIIENAPALDAA